MKQLLLTSLSLVVSLATGLAQRPATAPDTAPGGNAPDTVFIEELTWAEVRDLTRAGTTTVIVGTAGTEQKGPHMVDGEHKFVMNYAADKIARALGRIALDGHRIESVVPAATARYRTIGPRRSDIGPTKVGAKAYGAIRPGRGRD